MTPVAPEVLHRLKAQDPSLAAWQTGRFDCISGGFYKSQALQWLAPDDRSEKRA